MLQSIALILLVGLIAGSILKKIKMPSLVGWIIAGIIISPFMDKKLLSISGDLRQIALIIILTRAGLALNLDNLKKVGKSAILMSFVPASIELLACTIFAPYFLGLSVLDSALLGSVLAAVSPAVVAPRMIDLIEKNIGTKKGIPEMILAGSSVDDVYVIVFFSTFLSLEISKKMNILSFVLIPVNIIVGIVLGLVLAYLLLKLMKYIKLSKEAKLILLLSLSFLILILPKFFPIAPLLSIMTLGVYINKKDSVLCEQMKKNYENLWKIFEIILFVLVGVSLHVNLTNINLFKVILLIFVIQIFRALGVMLSLSGTKLNIKEKVFCVFSYIPKATVQAAIGSIPLMSGLDCGVIILFVSVVAILTTAPIGAYLIDKSKKLLL